MTSQTSSAILGLDPVFAHIDANRQPFLDRLLDYVRHPSISAQNIGMREVAGMLVDMLAKLGMSSEIIETTGHPVVLGRYEIDPAKPTVMLYGHYDVQPPDPLAEWVSPPFEPTIRDGRIYARGIGDSKGQHFAQILALESHLAVHGTLPCNVVVLLEGEEEIGSPSLAGFIRDNIEKLKVDFMVAADGPLHESGLPTIILGVRGIVPFDLVARGANRDTHSGIYGGVVPNPLWKLVHLLASMKTPEGLITIEGLHDPVVPPTAAARESAAGLPLDMDAYMADLGISEFDEPKARPFFDRLMFHPTLTIAGIHGGYGGEGSKSVIPGEAIAKCEIRMVDAMTPEQVLDRVEAHVKRHAPGVELVRRHGMLPSRTPVESPYTAVIRRAVVAARGVEPLLIPMAGGTNPSYVFTKVLGVPAFTLPYANADEHNHAPNENLKISCFYDGIRTGAALLATLGLGVESHE
ncbi:MAG TPA: M20/M25/M40 family metallo-hydrolase [Rhizobiaceae bacterium]|nr:M20/M25/M40 family metallo-hydrolase [Rhizobiaceae bacterium]